ncbi:hypothetical protein HanRHA438_Chr13g0613951 [Helianthus annuus]|nr:hypothetical protein HanHA300_Chr13g0495001 [Helianthus annuus]KAJ0498832.1 hypothetical protein HanHA89_Chr13g0527411 [Helianthus annuus]KAJ0664851.1 hypothetical protein HanLR1_Chr13g0497481 [Helianthus annuus]KAJ0859550.1 hypothetical protein HanRHA438_Chr13g0613951 [Helianthus annuus]
MSSLVANKHQLPLFFFLVCVCHGCLPSIFKVACQKNHKNTEHFLLLRYISGTPSVTRKSTPEQQPRIFLFCRV